jgi:hypothetical protein
VPSIGKNLAGYYFKLKGETYGGYPTRAEALREYKEETAKKAKDEGTVTWKTLPKPVHVSKPLQSVALRPGEEKEVYRPRTDKELSSSFGKDDQEPIMCEECGRREADCQDPSSHSFLCAACVKRLGVKAKDALPLPVPVKDDRPPLGGLKCQKCGKSVSEKTRQLGGPPLCALHRAIASGSGKDKQDGSTFVRAAEKAEQTRQWARASSMYRLAQKAFIDSGLMEQAAMAREDADRCAVSWTKAEAQDADTTGAAAAAKKHAQNLLNAYYDKEDAASLAPGGMKRAQRILDEMWNEYREAEANYKALAKKAKAQDAAPRYKPTDCIYNPPS